LPVRERYASADGWRRAALREDPGDFYTLFVELEHDVLVRYAETLIASPHWLQRRTRYGDLPDAALRASLAGPREARLALEAAGEPTTGQLERLASFPTDVREEYFSALAHLLDSRYYRTHAPAGRELRPGK